MATGKNDDDFRGLEERLKQNEEQLRALTARIDKLQKAEDANNKEKKRASGPKKKQR